MRRFRCLISLTLLSCLSVCLPSCSLLGLHAPKLELSKNYFIFTHDESQNRAFLQEEFDISPQSGQSVYVTFLCRRYAANESNGLAEKLGVAMAWARSNDSWYVLANHNMYYKIDIQAETHIASDDLTEFDETDQSLFLLLQNHPETFFGAQVLDNNQSIEWEDRGYVKFEELN